jgi:hypothetical protein
VPGQANGGGEMNKKEAKQRATMLIEEWYLEERIKDTVVKMVFENKVSNRTPKSL